MGRGSRASAARPWQGVAISRWIRQGEPSEAERHRFKETVLRVHLAKTLGDKRLDEISTEDVQRLKAALAERAPKDCEQHPHDAERGAEDGKTWARPSATCT
jgi:hypothetical protein